MIKSYSVIENYLTINYTKIIQHNYYYFYSVYLFLEVNTQNYNLFVINEVFIVIFVIGNLIL